MSDYGHDLRFGAFLTPSAAQPQRVVALAQLCEQVGLDLVSFQDHPYQPTFLDTWTLMSVVAAATERITVLPNVANLPLRPPVVLARSAASLDLLSGGRLELGLGSGGFLKAVAQVGGPQLTTGESVEALEEAIGIIRGIWSEGGERVSSYGHYSIDGAKPGPAPAHDIGIWLGSYKPRMLRLTGRLGDGWLPSQGYAGPEATPELNKIIDDAALAAGRSPADVVRAYNLSGGLDAEELAELTLTQGFSVYILASDDPDALRRFAAEVAPTVRELVESGRSTPTPVIMESAPVWPPTSAATIEVKSPRFGVTPTPDDGVRLAKSSPWDESERPTGPAPEPGRRYSARETASGQHLVDVHEHLRQELLQVRQLVEQVASGALPPGAARSHINTMTMRQNNWTLGTYCESYCRVVTTHHTIEDQSMFPAVRAGDPRLGPVIDRLEAEHHVIHDVLEGVDRALVEMVGGEIGVDGLREAVNLLSDTLLSHLSYEERELVEPLARLGLLV